MDLAVLSIQEVHPSDTLNSVLERKRSPQVQRCLFGKPAQDEQPKMPIPESEPVNLAKAYFVSRKKRSPDVARRILSASWFVTFSHIWHADSKSGSIPLLDSWAPQRQASCPDVHEISDISSLPVSAVSNGVKFISCDTVALPLRLYLTHLSACKINLWRNQKTLHSHWL